MSEGIPTGVCPEMEVVRDIEDHWGRLGERRGTGVQVAITRAIAGMQQAVADCPFGGCDFGVWTCDPQIMPEECQNIPGLTRAERNGRAAIEAAIAADTQPLPPPKSPRTAIFRGGKEGLTDRPPETDRRLIPLAYRVKAGRICQYNARARAVIAFEGARADDPKVDEERQELAKFFCGALALELKACRYTSLESSRVRDVSGEVPCPRAVMIKRILVQRLNVLEERRRRRGPPL